MFNANVNVWKGIKEFSLCQKLKFSNSFICSTWWCIPWIFQVCGTGSIPFNLAVRNLWFGRNWVLLHWKKLSSSMVFCIGRNLVVKWWLWFRLILATHAHLTSFYFWINPFPSIFLLVDQSFSIYLSTCGLILFHLSFYLWINPFPSISRSIFEIILFHISFSFY